LHDHGPVKWQEDRSARLKSSRVALRMQTHLPAAGPEARGAVGAQSACLKRRQPGRALHPPDSGNRYGSPGHIGRRRGNVPAKRFGRSREGQFLLEAQTRRSRQTDLEVFRPAADLALLALKALPLIRLDPLLDDAVKLHAVVVTGPAAGVAGPDRSSGWVRCGVS
jgi:hypothetical protein